MTAKGFAAIGKTVHEIGKEKEILHQQGVGSQDGVTKTRTKGGEAGGDGNQKEGAKEDVAIHAKEKKKGLATTEQLPDAAAQVSPTLSQEIAVAATKEEDGEKQPCTLRAKRAKGDAADAAAKTEDENKTEQHVQQVLKNGKHHRTARILHAKEPTTEAIDRQDGGRTPDKNGEIVAHEGRGGCGDGDKAEGHVKDRALQCNDEESDDEGETQRTGKYGETFLAIPGATGLGGESAGAHAQKTEQPKHHAEHHAAQGYGTDAGGGVKVSCNGGVSHGKQRHGEIGNDARNGDLKNATIHGDYLLFFTQSFSQ